MMSRILETEQPMDFSDNIGDLIHYLMSGQSREQRWKKESSAREGKRMRADALMEKAAAAQRQMIGVPLYTQGMHAMNAMPAPDRTGLIQSGAPMDQGIIDMIQVPQKRKTGLAVAPARKKQPNIRVIG